jgi:hypothetical protein
MKRTLNAAVPRFVVLILLAVLAAHARQAPAAPVPRQILAAKKVFIANAGGEQPWYEDAQFSGGADRAYNQFYVAVKTWGRYELTAIPADADLIFEIQFMCPPALGAANQGGDSLAGRPFDPHFRLAIREAKTNSLLWAFSERAQWAVTRGNRDKNFDQALNRVVSDVEALVGSSATAAGSGNP